jgi:diguanylate cyclase (GGDEF)-like protein
MNASIPLNEDLLLQLRDVGIADPLANPPTQSQWNTLLQHLSATYSIYTEPHIHDAELLHHNSKLEKNSVIARQDLAAANEKLLLAMGASDLAFFNIDLTTGKIFLNDRWAVLMEQESGVSDITLASLIERVHPEDLKMVQDAYVATLKGRIASYKIEHRLKTAKGNWRWILSHCKVVERNIEGRALRMAGTVIDINDRKLSELRAEYLAQHDELTDLPNRVSFNNSLQHAIRLAARKDTKLAVMFIDLDRFKIINDSLGHDYGDYLLQDISQRLKGVLRDSDIVARLGGDEFVVLIEEWQSMHDLSAVSDKILKAVAKPFIIDNQEYDLTTSVGVSTFPQHGVSAQELLRHADVAMYRAKELGKNNYQFYTSLLDFNSVERLRLETALRRAVNRDELVLHYQPIVNLETGYLVGMEALLRWQHPEQGLLSPAVFMPIAEETGLIVSIGEWVLRTACEQNRKWHEMGYGPMRVSVNLSTRQFQPSLVDMVTRVLEETGLAPQLLELEITESMVMQHPDQAVRMLNELSHMGILISIDDFGTGYSSLAYLKRFAIDSLKIDRSFVAEATTDSDNAAIIRAIIQMAHGLEIRVVAEGVETAAQALFLRDHHCDRVQGYHFSKPLPNNEFELIINHFPLSDERLMTSELLPE